MICQFMSESKTFSKWWLILIWPFVLYKVLRTCTYYITGTGTVKYTQERIFWRMCLKTTKGVVPIKSVEEQMKNQLELDKAIVLHFHIIPDRMVKYIEHEYSLIDDPEGPQVRSAI